jgi:hypothetical protein
MPRLGPSTYAIIANCELVTVVVVGATVRGEKLTPTHALGGGLILAGTFLRGWARDRASAKRLRQGSAGRCRCRPDVSITYAICSRGASWFWEPHEQGLAVVASMPAPVASGWSEIAGWTLHPLESAVLSRRTPTAAIA